jgi:hypothetical protein
VIRSVSFLAISIIDIEKEKSYILGCKQLITNDSDKANSNQEPKTSPRENQNPNPKADRRVQRIKLKLSQKIPSPKCLKPFWTWYRVN